MKNASVLWMVLILFCFLTQVVCYRIFVCGGTKTLTHKIQSFGSEHYLLANDFLQFVENGVASNTVVQQSKLNKVGKTFFSYYHKNIIDDMFVEGIINATYTFCKLEAYTLRLTDSNWFTEFASPFYNTFCFKILNE